MRLIIPAALILAALATGAHAFVTKVAAATDLIPAIQAVVAGKNFISQVQP